MRVFFQGWVVGVLLSALSGTANGFVLLPALSVSEEYTDNFFVKQSDKKEEFTTRLSPEFAATHKTRDLVFSGKYTGGIALYAHHREENRFRHRLFLDLALPRVSRLFRGLTVQMTEVAEYSPERPALPLGDPADTFFGVSLDRVKTFRHRDSLRVNQRWSPQWISGLTYTHAATHYEGALFEDRVVHNTEISQTYQMARGRLRLTVAYRILNTDYDRTPSSRAERVSLRGKQVLRPTLSLEGGIGRSWAQEGFSVTTSDIGLSHRTAWALLDVYYFRDIEAGEGTLAALGLNQRYLVKISHPMNAKTLVAAKLDHREEDTLSGVITHTRFTGATVMLTRRFSPILSGSVFYTYAKDKEPGLQAESNLIALALRISPRGWRL